MHMWMREEGKDGSIQYLKSNDFCILYYASTSYIVFTKEKGYHSAILVSKPVKTMFSSSDLLKFVSSHRICGRLGASDNLTNDLLVPRQ